MPGLNGYETAEHIRKSNKIKVQPKIILSTAYTSSNIHENEFRSQYINLLLFKPHTYSTLFEAIMDVFGKNSPKLHKGNAEAIWNSGALSAFAGAKILLVEDNEMNQEIEKELLERMGFEVEIAGNGKIALEKIKRGNPDDYALVFMDIQMPEMDGYTATREIRKLKNTDTLPIVAMTADVIEVKKQALDAGMWDVIYKPIDLKEVAEAIIRWGRKPKRSSTAISEEKQSKDTKMSIKVPLERIEGIDIKKGLERVNNNRELYVRILQKFLSSTSSFQKKTIGLLQNNNTEEIKAQLHSLKGVSGNLGATAIYEKLAETEKAFAHGIPKDAQAVINELNDMLEAFRKSVLMVIGKEPLPGKPPAKKTDVKTLLTELEKMKQHFGEGDMEGGEIFNKLYPKLLDITETILLKNAVDQYNFDKAAEITTLIIEKIKNNIS